MVDAATEAKWIKLLPILKRAADASQGGEVQ